MADVLILKWGTLKAWHFQSPAAQAAAKKYGETGTHSMGAAQQRDDAAQKQALLDLIDAVDCDEICNDWTGEMMTKAEAKEYVTNFGKEQE